MTAPPFRVSPVRSKMDALKAEAKACSGQPQEKLEALIPGSFPGASRQERSRGMGGRAIGLGWEIRH